MPRDPASRNETLREPVVGPVDQVRRLMELRRHSERVPHPRLVVPGIVERTLGLTLMNIGQLIKHLPQRPHRRRQLPNHPIHLRRLIEPPTRVRPPRNASEASAASAAESKNVGIMDLLARRVPWRYTPDSRPRSVAPAILGQRRNRYESPADEKEVTL